MTIILRACSKAIGNNIRAGIVEPLCREGVERELGKVYVRHWERSRLLSVEKENKKVCRREGWDSIPMKTGFLYAMMHTYRFGSG